MDKLVTVAMIGIAAWMLWHTWSGRPTAATAPTEVDRLIGRSDSSVGLIVFTDVQCPFCAQFASTTLPAIRTDYIDPGSVALQIRHLPIEVRHPLARQAAEAIECAADQKQALAFHDALFSRGASVHTTDGLHETATALGMNRMAFETCISTRAHRARVDRDIEQATRLSVAGTPTILVGTLNRSTRELTVTDYFGGLVSTDVLRAAIDKAFRVDHRQRTLEAVTIAAAVGTVGIIAVGLYRRTRRRSLSAP